MEIHKILNRGEAFVSKLLLGTEMKVRRVMGFANPLHHSYGHMPTKPTKPTKPIDIKVGKIRYPRARDHAVVRTSLIPFFMFSTATHRNIALAPRMEVHVFAPSSTF